MFDSRDVAAYIAQECDRLGIGYNNTKIQKLLYCAYGILLAWKGERICDEYPRLWPYGPVFPKVFRYIKSGNGIAGYSSKFASGSCDDMKTVISRTLEIFGKYSAVALSNWSHNANSPWSRARNEGALWSSFIPDEYIRDYFRDNVISGN